MTTVRSTSSSIDPQGSPRIPAWGFSVGLHAALIVLLALIVPESPRVLHVEEERPVGIVLSDATEQLAGQEFAADSSDTEITEEATSAPNDSAGAPGQLPSPERIAEVLPTELALPAANAFQPNASIGEVGAFTAGLSGTRKIPTGVDVAAEVAQERQRLKGLAPRGEPTQVQLFGAESGPGRKFVFLIDRSKSMGHEGLGALERAEKELLSALHSLEPHHQFQVIAYHHKCAYVKERKLLDATEENKLAVKGFLTGLVPLGATEHEVGLLSALQHQPDIIFLLTDGGDPKLSRGQIQKITKLSVPRTAIHCIQFGFGPKQEPGGFLEQLAEMNRGTFRYIDVSDWK